MSDNFNEKDKIEAFDDEIENQNNEITDELNDDVEYAKDLFEFDSDDEISEHINNDIDYDDESSESDDDIIYEENAVSPEDAEAEIDIEPEDINQEDDTIVEDTDEDSISDGEKTDSSHNQTEDSKENLDNTLINKLNRKISEFKKKDPNKRAKLIFILSSVALIFLLIFTDIIPILPNAYNRFYVGNTYHIGETQGSVFDKFGEDVLYAGNGVLMSFGPDMSCNFKVDTPSGIPKLETCGNNAIVYYTNSNDTIVVKDGRNTQNIKTENIITCATINSKGYYGLVTKEPGYESYVEVFNNSGTSIYKYHTNNPIIDIAVSDNGKSMIASSYELNDEEISGKLIFIDLTSDKPGKEVILQSNLVSEVKFINKDTVAAFGDLCTVGYSVSGVEKWRIKYNSRSAKSYDISSTGDMAFIFDRYTSELSESTVEIYGTDGKMKGKYESKGNVKYISANNDYFLLSLDRQTVLLDDEADVANKKNTSKDFRKAVLYSNYNFAFSVTNGVSEIMSVNH